MNSKAISMENLIFNVCELFYVRFKISIVCSILINLQET